MYLPITTGERDEGNSKGADIDGLYCFGRTRPK